MCVTREQKGVIWDEQRQEGRSEEGGEGLENSDTDVTEPHASYAKDIS